MPRRMGGRERESWGHTNIGLRYCPPSCSAQDANQPQLWHAPSAAAAQATFSARTVPATPLLPVIPFSLGRAQSSVTTAMILAFSPSAFALSTAAPKCSLSP